MSKLAKREKILLYILAIVALAAAGWFLIRPALEESVSLDQSISEAQTQKSVVEQVIASRLTYAEGITDANVRIDAVAESFLPAMTNDDLDRYITGLMQENGLVAESLQISASADEASAPAVTRLYVKVSATGALSQFTSLVQQLSTLTGIRISTFVVRQSAEKTTEVPLSEEELAAREAEAAAAGKKLAETDETPVKEVTYMEYGVELGFEVAEYDEALLRALIG